MSAHDALDNDHNGLLSEATLTSLSLHHQPFTSELRDAMAQSDQSPDGAAPFSDAVTEEQLADIKQALITGDDLLLILGESGAGKTTLLRQLNDNSGLRIQCFSVNGNERFSTLNLFSGMLEAFKRPTPDKLKSVLDDLIPCLQSMVGRNTLSVIVLDDAHLVSQNELTQLLSSMLYLNSQDETLMRMALAATVEFEDAIPDFLPDGADLPYSSLTIEGFIPSRAAAYLDYRLQLAGFDQEFPFTERDMASLVDHSGGKPGELHLLTADVLNEKYGRLPISPPRELFEEAGFLQSRNGKLALGALATVLIIGGLLLFMPPADEQPSAPSNELDVASLDEQSQIDTPKLELIDPDDSPASLELDTTPQDSVGSGNDISANTDDTDDTATSAVSDTAPSETPGNEPLIFQENADDTADEAGQPSETGAANSNQSGVELSQADSSNAGQNSTQGDTSSAGSGSANSDSTDSGSPDSGSPDSGITDSGITDSGATDSGTTDSGTTDSGATDSGATDSGTTDSGSTDSGTTDSGTSETGTSDTSNADSDSTEPSTNEDQSQQLATAETQTSNIPLPVNTDTEPSSGNDTAPVTDTNSSAPALDAAPDIAALLESPTWILVQDDDQFTVQMSASRDLTSIQNFLLRNPLPLPNSIFSFERNGEVWYALVHGIFPSLAAAQQAVERMPAAAQRDQPWIRSVARIKSIMR